MNTLIIALLFSTIITITSGKTFLCGKREDDDRLVYHRFIRAPANPYLKLNKQFIYPEKNIYKRLQSKLIQHLPTISAINITDSVLNGNDGVISLTAGGAGHQYVIFEFKSDIGRPINYEVTIYAFYTY